MAIPQYLLDTLPTQVNVYGDKETREVRIKYIDPHGEFVEAWLSPNLSLKIDNHSPDGFNWGYSGSGPSQLSLAFLMYFLPVHYAYEHYQDFKRAVIAGFPQTSFDIDINFREIVASL